MDPRRNDRLGAGGDLPRGASDGSRSIERSLPESAGIAAGTGRHGAANPFAVDPLPVLRRESERLFAGCDLVLHTRAFGDVRVHFYLPVGIQNPFALNDEALHTPKKLVTQTWVLYVYGAFALPIPPRRQSDGGSIPGIAQWLFGYDPLDDDVWAYWPHDEICEHPEVLPRGIGDAILGHLLEAIAAEKKKRRRDALRKFWAVRLYTRLLEYVKR